MRPKIIIVLLLVLLLLACGVNGNGSGKKEEKKEKLEISAVATEVNLIQKIPTASSLLSFVEKFKNRGSTKSK